MSLRLVPDYKGIAFLLYAGKIFKIILTKLAYPIRAGKFFNIKKHPKFWVLAHLLIYNLLHKFCSAYAQAVKNESEPNNQNAYQAQNEIQVFVRLSALHTIDEPYFGHQNRQEEI